MSPKHLFALLLIIVAGLCVTTNAASAREGHGTRAASHRTSLKLLRLAPIRIRAKVMVFKPAEIAPSKVRRATLRFRGGRRAVPLRRVRHALADRRAIRLIRPHRLTAQPANRAQSGAEQQPAGGQGASAPPAQGVRLEITYQAPSPPLPDYYVSPDGSDRNPGTKAEPFLSLEQAYTSAVPGDTVEVEGGVYTAQQTIPYDAAKAVATAPVTFVATEDAHFVAEQPTSAYWTQVKGSNVTFHGSFEFDFVYIRNDAQGMSNVKFEDTWIHHLSEGGNLNGLYLEGNRMGPNNLWPSTGSTPTSESGPEDILNLGIEGVCSSPSECFARSAKDVNIVGNSFNGAYHSWDSSHSDCIQFTVGQSGYIAGNTFRNCQSNTMMIKDDLGPIANIVIENNYLGRPLDSTNPYPIQITPCSNCVIRFNSAPASASLMIPLTSTQGTPTAPNERVYGNIAGHYDSGQCARAQTAGWTWSYNLFIGTGPSCGSNAATKASALYVDESSMDLSIPPSSPAVDFYKGSEPVPTTDIDGTPRPQGGYPDAGAYEAH